MGEAQCNHSDNIDHRLTKKTLAAISVGETVGPLSWGSAKYWSEGRICCFFGLPLIFLDFFSLHFSFVYLSCVPSATCAGYDNDKLGR